MPPVTAADKEIFDPAAILSGVAVIAIEGLTVTMQVAVLPQTVAVISAVPDATAVTIPFDTVATLGALDAHVMF